MAEVSWRNAGPEERGSALLRRRIRIWWDGDRTFYEGDVVGYDTKTGNHKVIYYGEDTDVYIEDLDSGSQQWELAVPLESRNKSSKPDIVYPTQSIGGGTAGRKSTYVDMALEAVTFLNENDGVSLSSIRKWILLKYPDTKEKQKASFNNLTIKGLMKLVSEGTLEKVKHSFRLSQNFVAENKACSQHDEAATSRKRAAPSLQHQAEESKAGRRGPTAAGSERRPSQAGGGEEDNCEANSSTSRNGHKNKRMRGEFEERTRKRNEFLSQRRALLLPFMHDGDNFFTRMDRTLATGKENAEKEQRERRDADIAAKARAQEALREAEAKRHATALEAVLPRGEGEREPPAPAPPLRPPPAPAPPPEVNPVDEIEFKAIPADPMTVAETLVKMGLLKREDIAPGAAKVALTGQRCTEWPPLQVDPLSGVPTMEDRDTLGARIEQEGPFYKYFIAWPGNRLPVDDLREVSQVSSDVNYSHIYYLEKREFVAPPPPPVPTLGPHGWVYPPQPPPPAARILGRTTAMRLRSGEFVQHRVGFMKKTQAYAKRSNVPVDNLVTFSIINPHTRRRYNVTREFCAAPCYASIYKRLLRDTLRKNSLLIPVLARQAPGAVRIFVPPAHATPAKNYLPPTNTNIGGDRGGTDSMPKEAHLEPPQLPTRAPAAGGFVPGRSHPLPRGPGGIDILSGPPPEGGVAKEERELSVIAELPESGSACNRDGPGDDADAAALAAAAMLGLGACATSSGRGGGSENVSGGGGEQSIRSRRDPELSNGHSSKVSGRLGVGGENIGEKSQEREGGTLLGEEGKSGHRGHNGLENGAVEQPEEIACREFPSLTPESEEQPRIAAEVWNCKARAPLPEDVKGAAAEAGHWQALQSEASRLPVDPTLFRTVEKRLDRALSRASRECRREQEQEHGKEELELERNEAVRISAGKGFVKREAIKQEGREPEDTLSRRRAERAARRVLSGFDPSDVLKGVPTVPVPMAIKATLHDHQKDGLRWMVNMYLNGMPMILGDQMGLGKTLQTITFIAYLRDHLGVAGPYLVVVPLSVLSNWMSEILRFCPSLRTVRFHGPREERNRIKEEQMKQASEFDVVVTTYEMLSAEANFFKRRFLWQLVIVDEGHRLKNEKSQLSQKLKQVDAICRVLLTGTPLQNNLRELWALLHFLVPDVFGLATAERFEQGFDLLKGMCNPRRMEQANELLSLFMLRRVKAQVKIDLPPKQEVQILVKLSPAQHKVYKHLLINQDRTTLDAIMAEARRHDVQANVRHGCHEYSGQPATLGEQQQGGASTARGRVSREMRGVCEREEQGEAEAVAAKSKSANDTDYRKLMNLLLQLRKVCNHPYLLVDVEPNADESEEQALEKMIAASGKLTLLDRMLPKLQERGHRCLIFSQFTSMLDILEDYCAGRGYEYTRLDGDTNRVRRRLDIRRFNAPFSKVFVFLISTRAGGLGINLASADTVILYDSDWNPQVDLQAMERAHRIGQTKPVKIYRLVCRGSVEERMVSRAEKKLFLNDMVGERRDRNVKKEPYVDGSIDSEEDSEGDSERRNEDGGGEEWKQALTVEGLSNSMSKGKLASLIHQGARAILQTQEEGDLTDQELENIISASARNAPDMKGAVGSASDSAPSSPNAAAAAAALVTKGVVMGRRCGSLGLQEVDLRQLDGVTYARADREKRPPGGVLGGMLRELDEVQLHLGEKRPMKKRVVMVDSDTPGIRGKLAVLAETMADVRRDKQTKPKKVMAEGAKQRAKKWRSMKICMLCGRGKTRSKALVSCGFCPRSFHAECLDQTAGSKVKPSSSSSATFVCPQHRCVGCTRTTAAAGGLLFRCQTCVNAFCEDCLPEDEVESLGRNRQLEALGYFSEQSYWIRCEACVEDGRQLQLDGEGDPSPRVTCGGREVEDCEGEASGGGSIEDTASFRRNNEGSRNGPAEKQKLGVGGDMDGVCEDGGEGEGEEDGDEDDEEELEEEEEEEPLSFAVALTLLQDHPAADEAFLKPRDESSSASGSSAVGKRSRGSSACSVELIAAKVQAGRYRSTVAFESDARQLLTQGKGPRSISAGQKQLVEYFEQEILPRLRKS